jgi:uncharacterized phage protein (TIGR01671 family)
MKEEKFMKEIEFRGRRIDNGEWVYGYYLVDDQHDKPQHCIWTRESVGDFIANDMVEVDPNTVGQYTGLKDKNGKKIFEGDILQNAHKKTHALKDFNDLIKLYWSYAENELKNVEIIGDIYTTPELIK